MSDPSVTSQTPADLSQKWDGAKLELLTRIYYHQDREQFLHKIRYATFAVVIPSAAITGIVAHSLGYDVSETNKIVGLAAVAAIMGYTFSEILFKPSERASMHNFEARALNDKLEDMSSAEPNLETLREAQKEMTLSAARSGGISHLSVKAIAWNKAVKELFPVGDEPDNLIPIRRYQHMFRNFSGFDYSIATAISSSRRAPTIAPV